MPAEGKKNYDVIPPLTSHFAKKRSLTNRFNTDANVCTFLLLDLHQFEKQLTDFRRNFATVIKATTLTG